MSTDDFRINAAVNNTLVRLWIEASRLKYGTTNGVVYFRGVLSRMNFGDRRTENTDEEVTLLVRRLDSELRSIKGVREVTYNLDNVVRQRGRWMAREAS